MDVFKEKCIPQDNPLSIPVAVMHHHFSEDIMQGSLHFPVSSCMDQLKDKQEKLYAAKAVRIEKQQGKVTNC